MAAKWCWEEIGEGLERHRNNQYNKQEASVSFLRVPDLALESTDLRVRVSVECEDNASQRLPLNEFSFSTDIGWFTFYILSAFAVNMAGSSLAVSELQAARVQHELPLPKVLEGWYPLDGIETIQQTCTWLPVLRRAHSGCAAASMKDDRPLICPNPWRAAPHKLVDVEARTPVDNHEEIYRLFPKLTERPLAIAHLEPAAPEPKGSLRIGVVLSGGQAAGGHNGESTLFPWILCPPQ
jgi:hypothetical protein